VMDALYTKYIHRWRYDCCLLCFEKSKKRVHPICHDGALAPYRYRVSELVTSTPNRVLFWIFLLCFSWQLCFTNLC
jgi:hypothetical protein